MPEIASNSAAPIREQRKRNSAAYHQSACYQAEQRNGTAAYVARGPWAAALFKDNNHDNHALGQTGRAKQRISSTHERTEKGGIITDIRNEIKAYIVREGMTMSEVVERLAEEYGWSESVPNLSGKLRRGSLRYGEAIELADVLGYDIIWQKRK